MSQVPNAEPQAAEGASPAGQGTSGEPQAQQFQELQQKLAAAETQVQELRQYQGWQKEFTRSKQSGLYDWYNEQVKQAGDAAAVQKEFQTMRGLLDEVGKLGGLDKIKEAVTLWNDIQTPTAAPNAPAAQSAEPPPAGLTRDEVLQIFREASEATERNREFQAGLAEVAERVLIDAGLAKEGEVDADALATCRLMLETRAKALAGDRGVEPEDIAAAGQFVFEKFVTPLRASGAQAVTPQPTTAVPPLVNARGPGGQQPAKPVAQMTPEEQREYAMNVVRQSQEAFGPAPAFEPAGARPPMGVFK